MPNDVDVVLDDDDRVSVADQRLHGGDQAFDIARVQPDRRFVKDVEHPGGVGSHRRGQLDPLPLPGRQGRAGAIELKVGEAELEQRIEDLVQLAGQADSHPADFVRQQGRQPIDEHDQLVKGEGADLGEVAPVQSAAQRFRPQPGAVADRADPLDQEFLRSRPGLRIVAAGRALRGGDCVVVVDRQGDLASGAGAQRDRS